MQIASEKHRRSLNTSVPVSTPNFTFVEEEEDSTGEEVQEQKA